MIPTQGFTLMSRLPQAWVNRHLAVMCSRLDSPQVSLQSSISATISLDSTSRTPSGPNLFSIRLRCRV